MIDAIDLISSYKEQTTNPILELDRLTKKLPKAQNAFISMSLDRAYREAYASNERWRTGNPISSWDGIPIAWKDLFDLHNFATTAGSVTAISKIIVKEDAELIRKATRLGLMNIGKTNLTELAYSGLGLNPHYGTPTNIYGADYIPGGSSSGSAVAVGRGIVPIAIGTDTAGSIRIPAAFNGLVGYKSSRDRYSKKGLTPLAKSLDSIGPITRSVRDCLEFDRLFNIGKRTENNDLDGKKLFIVDVDLIESLELEEAVETNFWHSIEIIRKAGADIKFKSVTAFQQALAFIENGEWLGAAEAYTLHQKLLESEEAYLVDNRVRNRLDAAKNILASTQIRLYQSAEYLKQLLKQELNEDCLLTPTVAHTAPRIEPLLKNDELFVHTNLKTLKLTMPGSYLNMPGVALPNGYAGNGLPTSILVSGSENCDLNVLHSAEFIEFVIKENQVFNSKTT